MYNQQNNKKSSISYQLDFLRNLDSMNVCMHVWDKLLTMASLNQSVICLSCIFGSSKTTEKRKCFFQGNLPNPPILPKLGLLIIPNQNSNSKNDLIPPLSNGFPQPNTMCILYLLSPLNPLHLIKPFSDDFPPKNRPS